LVLCDIGNTYFHFYRHGRIWKERVGKITSQFEEDLPIYYISVNAKGTKKLKAHHEKSIDLSPFFRFDSVYRGIGIDRVAACKAVHDGVVVDAGSAITLDVMQNGMHLGGYILPGITQFSHSYAEISPVLDVELNMGVDLAALPQNTKDAVSYGVLKSILLMIKNSSKSKKLYFSGGDGKFLSRFFENSIHDNSLVFKGMLKVINDTNRRSD